MSRRDRDLLDLVRDVVAEVDAEEARAATPAARRFLEGLDPESQEGLWFEAIADRYPSRLDAAIAYVLEVKRR